MAQAAKTKKTNRRQSPKRALSSSSVRKNSAKKKQPTRNKTKKFILPLPKNTSLTIALKVTPKPKARTKKKKQSKKGARRQKLLIPVLYILLGFTGVFYAAWQINSQPVLKSTVITPVPPLAAPTSVKKSLVPSDAVRIQIEPIQVDSPVSIVGTHPDGTLEVPSSLYKVGQYRQAPTPGEIGPAILTGHVGTPQNHAVFWRLRELVPGQLIKIVRQDGSVATFRVDTVKNVSQNDNFPTQEVYGNIEYAGLRLITCGGTFNYITRRYNENTVVFASLVL